MHSFLQSLLGVEKKLFKNFLKRDIRKIWPESDWKASPYNYEEKSDN